MKSAACMRRRQEALRLATTMTVGRDSVEIGDKCHVDPATSHSGDHFLYRGDCPDKEGEIAPANAAPETPSATADSTRRLLERQLAVEVGALSTASLDTVLETSRQNA